VFFDFGGVFIDSPFALANKAALRLGVTEEHMIEVVFGPYGADSDHPWHRLERGELSFDAARAEIADLAKAAGFGAVDPMDVLAELGASHSLRPFMVDAVRDLRGRGLICGVITNNIAEFGSTWRKMIPVDELFDDVVDSSAVGVRKPDAAIYRLACERVGVEPAAALFIDDYQGNVDGAIGAGLRAICCGYSVDSTRAALAELLSAIA
jgi:epoxide hydrolase-like predicted phosphatase